MSVDEILKSENGDAGASTAHQRRQKEMFVHGKVFDAWLYAQPNSAASSRGGAWAGMR